MKKAVKGNFGYLKTKKKQVIIRTLLYFGISLALYIAGLVSTGTNKNLLTVVAVLGCLPASKSLVNMIMFCRATGCSLQAKEAVSRAEGRLIGMYDMYFTSYQKNFALSHMVVEGKLVLGYTESSRCDIPACEEHLRGMLKQSGYKDMVVKIQSELTEYCSQLHDLNEKKQDSNPERDDEVRIVLYDISL